MTRCGIFGAGAIGGWVGGKLAAAGLPVALVGRAPAMAEARENGIELHGIDGSRSHAAPGSFTAGDDPALLSQAEVVFVAVKSPATAEAARALASALAPGAIVVSLQNGVRNAQQLRELLPGRTVLGGMVAFNVVVSPGPSLHQATSGPVVIERGPGAEAAAAALRRAGVAVEVRPDIEAVQWSKLLLNLNNAVNALSGLPLREELSQRGYRRVLAAAQREALAAMKRAGIRPVRFGRLAPGLAPLLLSLPDALFTWLAKAMISIDPAARSSMSSDLARARPTEIDSLNGEVLALAKKVGVAVPVNKAIVSLIHDAERAGTAPRLSASDLVARTLPRH